MASSQPSRLPFETGSSTVHLLLWLWAALTTLPAYALQATADRSAVKADSKAARAAACPAPTLQSLRSSTAVRAQLLSERTDGLQMVLLPQARTRDGALAGHWAHISESGPLNGTLVWVPCNLEVRSSSRLHTQPAVQAIPSGSFVAWRTLPAGGTLPPRLVLTHRRTGTGLESHQTEVVAVVAGRVRVLLRAVTWELAALEKLHETTASIAGLQAVMRVTIRTSIMVDGQPASRHTEHRCWGPRRSVYGP